MEWCKPCRNENPNVVAAYEKFHERGFEVFGVSLDGLPQQADGRTEWLTAIDVDGLTWTHVSDLQGWNTPLTGLYKFQGIPHSVLIDENGIIIAKNLRGPSLHKKLEEIFP
jgi:peroxiredoxin